MTTRNRDREIAELLTAQRLELVSLASELGSNFSGAYVDGYQDLLQDPQLRDFKETLERLTKDALSLATRYTQEANLRDAVGAFRM